MTTLKINELRREPSGAMYIAPERLCVTADGELCGEDDPRAVRLLVAKGCEIPAAEAAKYGLIGDSAAALAPPSAESAPVAPAAGEPAPATRSTSEEKPARQAQREQRHR